MVDHSGSNVQVMNFMAQNGVLFDQLQGIASIIADHTHRAVFENLSLTERCYLESKIKTDGVQIKQAIIEELF